MSLTDPDRLAALFQRHAEQRGYLVADDEGAAEAFLAGAGDRVLLLAEDPRLTPESWDVAVLLPELLAPVADRLAVALAPPAVARALAGRYAVNQIPALLFQRDGHYVGALQGMRDWADFQREIPAMLDKAPGRVPGIGIAVTTASSTCH